MPRVIIKEGSPVALRFHGLKQFKKDFSRHFEESENYYVFNSLTHFNLGIFDARYTVINGDLKKTGNIWTTY
jgi:hypothetical protein